MNILAIETSCDETSAAVIENGTKIISNVVASSQTLHAKTGGIIPEIAAREQIRCIIPVIAESLQVFNHNNQSIPSLSEIDAIAVAIGPGLIGSLLIGVETAKVLSLVSGKPIIPVNHIFAHIYANWLYGKLPIFPSIALVVSGGHTELFYMKSHGQLHWIGGTRDDAAGEAFDKTARLLNLGFPGGPAIAAAAQPTCLAGRRATYLPRRQAGNLPASPAGGQPTTRLPRPMIGSKDFDFSFAGLKTAVLREVNKLKGTNKFNDAEIQKLSYEIQESITDVLVKKTVAAAVEYKVKSILLGGGVAANKRLTEKFNSQLTTYNIELFVPPPSLCTDNAAYIASFAFFNPQKLSPFEIQAQSDLEVEV